MPFDNVKQHLASGSPISYSGPSMVDKAGTDREQTWTTQSLQQRGLRNSDPFLAAYLSNRNPHRDCLAQDRLRQARVLANMLVES